MTNRGSINPQVPLPMSLIHIILSYNPYARR